MYFKIISIANSAHTYEMYICLFVLPLRMINYNISFALLFLHLA